ncbi:glycerate kinase [Listeria ivanovii]|uniref:Glycerate kinase n=2 Tax=Listeria ivanovii TaxID=1638 RepID=A0ABS1G7W0_LISIV|nr:glycerate kinase [Listeria ivanovii]AIS59814.1 glycerate kinase [Listeria ivanovii subsp. londoniensis]MBK1962987.1 glycerate kinase [Listeria ivanovii subsp. londoniensis]MBM5608829.1 glycerate kinase [Listeria ivanovii]MBM5636627.1 glycerate kinase [Listeria ivanovii]MBM5706816.1 glycerate kinase [Listeria ivanovii]
MNIVIAPDAFKESASAMQVAKAIKSGWQKARPTDTIHLLPVSDGGEGLLAVLKESCAMDIYPTEVTRLDGKKMLASYGILKEKQIAVIESATVIGLDLITADKRNPALMTSFGVGELILDALNHNIEKIIIGLGGSGTNDGGAGLLQALGVQLLDKNNNSIKPGGIHLKDLAHLDVSQLDPCLKQVSLQIASDVTNPLLGEKGATLTFGRQKGATPEMLIELEQAMINYGEKLDAFAAKKVSLMKRSGAAGGIAAGLTAILNAEIISGADLVIKLSGLKQQLANADLVIIGEGKMDAQSVMGKIPVRVASEAKKAGAFVLAIVGSTRIENSLAYQNGIDAVFPIIPELTDSATIFCETNDNLARTAENIANLTSLFKKE